MDDYGEVLGQFRRTKGENSTSGAVIESFNGARNQVWYLGVSEYGSGHVELNQNSGENLNKIGEDKNQAGRFSIKDNFGRVQVTIGKAAHNGFDGGFVTVFNSDGTFKENCCGGPYRDRN